MTTAMITAFNNKLSSAFQSYPIAWPGVPPSGPLQEPESGGGYAGQFREPESGEWLEVAYFPAESENIAIGYDAAVVLRGFFQVTAASKGGGVISAMALANQIIMAFPRGTQIDAVRVLSTPYQMTPIYSETVRRIAVTIPYTS